jgi:Phage gp6-like head-tail connector protein
MFLSTQLVTPPLVEPITLAFAKQQLRVDADDDDAIITALITAAREHCEKKTHRSFFDQTWVRTLDFFPLYGHAKATRTPTERDNWPFGTWYWDKVTIDLPYPRTLNVQSITYLDNDLQLQTLPTSAYNIDYTSMPARIAPAQGLFWPILNNYIPGSVRITFTAGSYVQQVTEQFTIPSTAPYTYTPLQGPVTGIVSVIDTTSDQNDGYGEGGYGDGGYGSGPASNPAYTMQNGVLTFTSAAAGQQIDLTYNIGTCPQSIVQAMILLVKFWYQHSLTAPTPGVIPTPVDKAVDALLGMHKVNVIEYR